MHKRHGYLISCVVIYEHKLIRHVCYLQWSDTLQKLDFQEMVMFLQHLPTHNWNHLQLETVLSRAYMWYTMFNDSPRHLACWIYISIYISFDLISIIMWVWNVFHLCLLVVSVRINLHFFSPCCIQVYIYIPLYRRFESINS